jgi:hypothetical protein
MTLLEFKKKVLGLIEELNPNSELLTDDPDIATKMNGVVNQVMFEIVRLKKLPAYVEIPVEAGDLITFEAIEKAGKNEVYQIGTVYDVSCELKAQGTVIKALESGVVGIDYFRYPERITEKTKDSYEFDIPHDMLEVMVYGVAGDLLKSDISSQYGKIYSDRYENMKSMLDPRYAMSSVYVEGGVM